jgi:alpha-beta hydrolase superfamily lysophospholipase
MALESPLLMTSSAIEGAEGPGPGFADVAFPSLDGTPLRGRYWTQPNPRGVLLITHGLGEHGGSYRRSAEKLIQSLPIDILAFDFRGSGRSEGRRGVVRSYEDFSLDLDAANRWASGERPDLPRFLLGHSNGGLVALQTVLDRNLGLSGLIVSNPSLRVKARVPTWKRLAAEVLRWIAPGITLRTGLLNDQLTQDREIIAEIDADPLRHSRISPPLYFGMTAAGLDVQARGTEIRVPILMILGGSDPIIDPAVNRAFFETLVVEDKTLNVYPEMRHEPLNEVGRDVVMADLIHWLEPRLKRPC